MEGEQPQLGDLLTIVINHLPTGMILQVEGFPKKLFLFAGVRVEPSMAQEEYEKTIYHPCRMQSSPGSLASGVVGRSKLYKFYNCS